MAFLLTAGLSLAALAAAQPHSKLAKRNTTTTISASLVVGLLFVAIVIVTIVTWFGHIAHKKQQRKDGTHPDQLKVLRRECYQGRSSGRSRQQIEGLNEDGFAPPPYIPKNSSEEQFGEAVAVPMQTFSRGQPSAGATPPGYGQAGNAAGLTREQQQQQRVDEVNMPATKIPRTEEREVDEL